MTTCLGKSCSFGLPRVPFANCCQFMYFEGRILDLIMSHPGHCLSFLLGKQVVLPLAYFAHKITRPRTFGGGK